MTGTCWLHVCKVGANDLNFGLYFNHVKPEMHEMHL